MSHTPLRVITDEAVAACYDVMAELRPHLRRADFVARVREMEVEGYRLACLRDGDHVVCVAGYRIAHNLHLGKYLYVDDLVSAAARRGQGFGAVMLAWLRAEARTHGCRCLHLDSGTQRIDAHRFYFRHGMTIGSFHFYEDLAGDS